VRYVDDTFAFIKQGDEDYVKEKLDEYHPNIKFTYEVEKERKLPFLDVQMTKDERDGSLSTGRSRTPTST
jgi:hypothetical protein